MNCNLSGEPCEVPVLTPYGHIFEKALIEKHIKETGKCPITNNDLNPDQLTKINSLEGPARPRPASATSLASLLKLFQNEWDSIMLETFNLKKEYDRTKQELSNSLYQQDAACRVIARLMKERDEARKALADTQQNISAVIRETENNEKNVLPNTKSLDAFDAVVAKISDFAKALSKTRRKNRKKTLSDVISPETLSNFVEKSTVILNSESEKANCIELLTPSAQDSLVLIGSESGDIRLAFPGKVENSLKFHSDKVSAICALDANSFLSASADSKIAYWKNSFAERTFTVKQSYSRSTEALTGLAVQAMKQHFVVSSSDNKWAFYDLQTGAVLRESPLQPAVTCSLRFHPDGLIFGAGGTDSALRIWDIKSQKNVASFEGHKGHVKALDFSENGYFLASGDSEGAVKLWDLRKSENISTLQLSGEVKDVKFDPSGAYLGCAGDFGVSIYASKAFSLVKHIESGAKASALSFYGKTAAVAAVFPEDDSLRVFTAPSEVTIEN